MRRIVDMHNIHIHTHTQVKDVLTRVNDNVHGTMMVLRVSEWKKKDDINNVDCVGWTRGVTWYISSSGASREYFSQMNLLSRNFSLLLSLSLSLFFPSLFWFPPVPSTRTHFPILVQLFARRFLSSSMCLRWGRKDRQKKHVCTVNHDQEKSFEN